MICIYIYVIHISTCTYIYIYMAIYIYIHMMYKYGFAIDLGSLEMDSWVFPTILYMVELNCIMGTLLFPL